jgi:methylenetetrahydrofolate--tRNA-(uracil-5-)-methyltransferase
MNGAAEEGMINSPDPIIVIGAGLAGSQAALTIAHLGGKVILYEMRPNVRTPAHQTGGAAELVCSNSLRSNDVCSAAGLLKQELRLLGCDLIRIADEVAIPGGTALTVDRARFSQRVTELIQSHPHIEVRHEQVVAVPRNRVCILATGPLTSDALAGSIQAMTGEDNLSFHDAIAPVVDADSIDYGKVFAASRYGNSGDDFLNCPMNQQQYDAFRTALVSAEGYFKHEFDDLSFFGCPPLEQLARSGEQTLRHGPLKPVGLRDPRGGERPYAVLQLRRENLRSDSYNLVGCQNQIKFAEQQRVFGLVPGLERAQFIRFGQMHRNTYLRAPALLHEGLNLRRHEDVFVAGQLCGVEGYVEAMATGLLAGTNAWRRSLAQPPMRLPRSSALGSLCHYLVHAEPGGFAPVRFTFDLLPPLELDQPRRLPRETRRAMQCDRALTTIQEMAHSLHRGPASQPALEVSDRQAI